MTMRKFIVSSCITEVLVKGRRIIKHVEHVRYACYRSNLPRWKVLIEERSTLEHTAHAFYRGDIPRRKVNP